MPRSRLSADGRFDAIWRQRGLLACLLFMPSLLFRLIVAVRRILYSFGLLASERLPVQVVIVGNITVGGSGKTPLVIHLAQTLSTLGRRPGIVSRGYRGNGTTVAEVMLGSDPAAMGDEPVLLARRSGCPVFVGRDRLAAGRALLAAYPACDVILADDGLQHYQLQRDVELAVFDQRGVMNGWCLPAGPLREPVSRLTTVDAVVVNGSVTAPIPNLGRPLFQMRLLGEEFHRIDDPLVTCGPADLAGRKLHAVAGIGDPQRFFNKLQEMNLDFIQHAFIDHHDFCADDIAFSGDAILTTEKDAVKLVRLCSSLPVWVLPVTAELDPDLAAFVLEKLNGCSPA